MHKDSARQLRFIIAQTGARRNYAVPLILQKAQLLESFFTDVCGNVGWGRWLAWGKFLPLIGPKLERLAKRKVPLEIKCKTYTFWLPNFRWFWDSLWSENNKLGKFRIDVRRQKALADAALTIGFGEATHLYVMLSEFTPLLAYAQDKGLKVVSEIYILLSTNRLLTEERRQFPGWEPESPDLDVVLREFGYENSLFNHVDFYICPSENVALDLVENWNIERAVITVVPYGMSPEWLQLVPATIPGRILFVGTADLRKGIHYLAMAADILVKRGKNYEFRVAGHVSDHVRSQPMCRHLTFLGRVPRDLIQEEFRQADVFTLPSLAEGSAEVTYEALAAGIPLVITASAGSVARDDIEGRIIAERDPCALADAIESIIENRQLRERYSTSARRRGAEFTRDKYGERLLAALQALPV